MYNEAVRTGLVSYNCSSVNAAGVSKDRGNRRRIWERYDVIMM